MIKLLYNTMSCPAKDRNYAACRFTPEDTYCKHHTYLNEYTDEMFKKTSVCSTCKMWKFTGNYATCEECRERGIKNRQETKDTLILCAKEGCKFKKSENKYCGKHQALLFVEETQSLGMKPCKNYVRGCRSQNDMSYRFSSCQDCLQKERERDHARRSIVIEVKEPDKKACSACCKVFSMDSFEGLHGETKTCFECREANKRADEKRDAEHVKELARKNGMKPERKAVKLAWKEANYDKVAKHWMDARMRLIENDLEGYLKKNAETAKNWRDANPEKVKANNLAKINSMDSQYSVYKVTSTSKQLSFEITKGDFMEMVVNECYYCGIIQEKGFNGIDRLDSSEGYIMSNCVSCCQMCNYMKGCLGPTIFINRVEHIMTHLKIFQGKLHPEDFKDVVNVNFSDYKIRANKKDLDFDLSKSFFNDKIKEPCYLCGKNKTDTHKNGLDRFNNEKGYTETNIKSCCGNCNMIKRNYTYKGFIEKCKLICEKNMELQKIELQEVSKPKSIIIIKSKKIKIDEKIVKVEEKIEEVKPEKIVKEKEQQDKRQIVRGNKLTQEEKREKERLKKQKQREALREKYGDDEFKKMRAEEIARTRQKKKLNE